MKTKIVYLSLDEANVFRAILVEIPVKYNTSSLVQLLETRAKPEMLIEVDIPESVPPAKPPHKRAKK